ncbi:50S ribosomal subunit protein L13 [Wigglesworthia glossinidia endosymbiont of Glossina morsitans morsitans (Yale colony)]|uniref:Large ribosomal subunit protein uL13 n=1 Tax=Wigglesworthia glossinidia endosymbiont of Glossina morsitans morsitans (Yale colony) TaxID=1142511 RepID=H6Q5H3_WIGGL|nr:50S ribosomal protein L13 [Wigglesworthia glossinidia]AFA41456.1 50S ribosomal subunit protein L13 [Wigglesworthia glossinidia endosymbiont of Glossina morsitans morsitans (Yale colony)]
MQTFMMKKNLILSSWHLYNVENKILGRCSTKLAQILKGKYNIKYTPHLDMGDYIVVINAKKIKVSGKKLKNKFYYHHTGYHGGIKKITLEHMLEKNPEKVLYYAVKGMLPKGPLGKLMLKKLKIFSGKHHNHFAQKPKILN